MKKEKVYCSCGCLREDHEILEHFGMDATHYGSCNKCKCKYFHPTNKSQEGKEKDGK